MTFKAKYQREGSVYWRTIYADTLNEAMTIAKCYTRKQYTFAGLTQQMGALC